MLRLNRLRFLPPMTDDVPSPSLAKPPTTP